MNKVSFSFTSKNQSTSIHCVKWIPECEPVAVLQIIHGMTEYIERYDKVAEFFCERGYLVVGNDHIGHGDSIDDVNPHKTYFGPRGSWDYIVADVEALMNIVKSEYPGLPYNLCGFSLGSFIARSLADRCPIPADRIVIAGTGQTAALGIAVAQAIVKWQERKFGETAHTPLVDKLVNEAYNKYFEPCRTKFDWFIANETALDEYLADSRCGFGYTVGAFRELLHGMKLCSTLERVDESVSKTPILLISGKDDPVGDFGKGVTKVCEMLKTRGFCEVELKLLEGMRHDIFRESEYVAVLDFIYRWLSTGA